MCRGADDPQETTASRWRFPPLQHIPDRLGFLLVGKERRTLDLFLLYVCCAMGAHQPSTGWAPPIRARVKARLVRWAQTVEINTNILPLDLILSFNLSQSLLSPFLILYLPTPSRISAYEHASSSRSIADGLNSHNTPLGSETDTLTLGPLSSGKHRLYHKPMSTVCSLYTLGGKPSASGSADTFCHLYSQCISS